MLQSQGVLYVTTVDEDIKERESSQRIFASNICLHWGTPIDQINSRTNIKQFLSPSTLESNHTGKSVLQQFVFNFQQCNVCFEYAAHLNSVVSKLFILGDARLLICCFIIFINSSAPEIYGWYYKNAITNLVLLIGVLRYFLKMPSNECYGALPITKQYLFR